MLYSAALILSGNAAASVLTLARNLLLARLVPVEDYGIAATFALVMAAVEMVTALGLQQQIVQARQGDDARFQAALQGFQLLRGVLAGLALAVLAGPMAELMGVPEVAWAYALLGLVPVLNALQHFDIHRLNRHDRFAPLILTGTLPSALSFAAIWPLVLWLGDWRAMLWATLGQAAASVVISHLLAERPFRLRFDLAVTAQAMRFGWPLLANAVLMFVVFQADRLVVGHYRGMEALAIFSMGVTLTLTPSLVLAKSAQTLILPRLSAAIGPRFDAIARATIAAHLSVAVALAVLGAALGPWVVHVLLGAEYAALTALIAPLAAVQALRIVKVGPAIVALARGNTAVSLWGNLPRVLAFGIGWAQVAGGAGVEVLILWALVGEALGSALSFALAFPGHAGVEARRALPALALLALSLPAAILPLWRGVPDLTAPEMLVALACLPVALWLLRDLARVLRGPGPPAAVNGPVLP